ncbi:MAG: mandelate racemase/muconate lactonizing enzyme family protein [Thermomicrobium sp.]|nr:mandelate racemase/muconate lactonizing enzyme family protein [Thermomicrobium sp.]MDW8060154.1 mandelate racemase/muconate lactonizing enzyme family protein [Thermomicrobium sp.]
MRIVEVEFYGLRSRLPSPARFSWGEAWERNVGLVRVVTDEGLEGWGETSVTFPLWSLEERALTVRQGLRPLVLGVEWEEPTELTERLHRRLSPLGHLWSMVAVRSAVAAFEVALWDIVGQRAGRPLWALWGGSWQRVPLYAVGFSGDVQTIARQAAEAIERGFRAVKVRVGFDDEADEQLVRTVRTAIGPEATLLVDANMAYDRERARRMAERLAPYRLGWLEEPLVRTDVAGMTALRRLGLVPLAAGENAYTLEEAVALLEAEAVDVLMPDIARIGGLTAARAACNAARSCGLPYSPHQFGSYVGLAAALHLCAAEPGANWLLMDIAPWELREAVVESEPLVEGGWGLPPRSPGLGVRVNLARLEQFRVV